MKTPAQKYNDKMDKLLDPEITRLKKVEQIAKEVLTKIETLSVVCYVGNKCHVINAIQRILSEKTKLK